MLFPIVVSTIFVLIFVALLFWMKSTQIEDLSVSKTSLLLTVTSLLLTVPLIVWSVIAFQYNLQVEKEEFYKIVTSSYEDGLKIQTIKINDTTLNINFFFKGYVEEGKMIKVTEYKKWYAGLYFPIQPKFSIVDK